MKLPLLFVLLSVSFFGNAQSAWPATSWPAATNLTPAMSSGGVIELSGLFWNDALSRLYAVQNDGRIRVLQFDSGTNTFTQIGNKTLDGGPEGITQVNLQANEFYTIDENAYEIRKYTHNADFSTVTEARHWNLLASPSPMTDTGNTGPEGIAFIPDSALQTLNFVSSETGQTYTSTKGMGGLLFIAHQDGGYVWVFDVNPNVNNDFLFVGKYKTNRNESADLAFDSSTNLLYILHNIDSNYLEATNLSLAPSAGGEPRFATVAEYFIANPSGSNMNVEGFALSPNCPNGGFAWLCRDAASTENLSVRQDVLRWFNAFGTSGGCDLGVDESEKFATTIYPNPAESFVSLSFPETVTSVKISVKNILGQTVFERVGLPEPIDISQLTNGVYILEAFANGKRCCNRFVKR